MVEIRGRYDGDLRCTSRHLPSGAELATDAPRDNEGKGECFSPTDLVATALGSCMLTIMGIYARRHEIDLRGAGFRIEKHMQTDPRRIGQLVVEIEVPIALDARHREGLERAAMACPVKKSLHPEIDIPVRFVFGGEA
ncbi:MAG: OsmC family protein [Planctomycetota bacterium]